MLTNFVPLADIYRSELVVLEYQRDQARRELGDIEQNVLFRSREMAAGISPHRMIRSMDNIHIMTSPSLAESQVTVLKFVLL